MTASLTASQIKDLTEQVADCIDVVIEKMFARNPEHTAQLMRSGQFTPRDKALSRKIYMHGKVGLERLEAAREFEAKYGSNTAPAAVTLAQTSKPSGPPKEPEPAIRVRSDRKALEQAAAAAGALFAKKLADAITGIERRPKAKLEWRHAGRDYVAFVHKLRPYPGRYTHVKDMVRFAMVDGECDANANAFRSTVAAVEGALEDRDVWNADRRIREIGSPDGFSTEVVGI